jgi:L-cystine uptake protein TcyP (sodium:dicarboxylate symporter family)
MNLKTVYIIILSIVVMVLCTLSFIFSNVMILLPIAFIFLGILNIFNGIIQLKNNNKSTGMFSLISGILVFLVAIAGIIGLLFFK